MLLRDGWGLKNLKMCNTPVNEIFTEEYQNIYPTSQNNMEKKIEGINIAPGEGSLVSTTKLD